MNKNELIYQGNAKESDYDNLSGVVVYDKPNYLVLIRNGFDGWQAGFSIGVQTLWIQSNITPAPEENTKEYAMWMAENINDALSNLRTMAICGR